MQKYVYDGPVLFFGRFVCSWHGETVAESESKARNNLTYQYKMQNKKIAGCGGVGLPGKIREV